MSLAAPVRLVAGLIVERGNAPSRSTASATPAPMGWVGRSMGRTPEPRGHDLGELAPGSLEAFAIDEEGRCALCPGPPAPCDICQDPPAKPSLCERRFDLVRGQTEPLCHGEKILVREPVTPGEQQGVRLPEPSLDSGDFGELGREVRSRMQLGVGEVSPDDSKGSEAIQQGLHREAGREAERAPEVPVLDQGQVRRIRASDVVVVAEWSQRGGGRGRHPLYVNGGLWRSTTPASPEGGRVVIPRCTTLAKGPSLLARIVPSARPVQASVRDWLGPAEGKRWI